MRTTLDHEKLDVYRLALEFVAWLEQLRADDRAGEASPTRHVWDHLERASLSVALNIAEGNGRRRQQVRAKFFDDARGSATECAACIDVLVAKAARTAARVAEGKNLLGRIVAKLTALVHRFSSRHVVAESEEVYGVRGSDRACERERGRQEEIEIEDEIEIEEPEPGK